MRRPGLRQQTLVHYYYYYDYYYYSSYYYSYYYYYYMPLWTMSDKPSLVARFGRRKWLPSAADDMTGMVLPQDLFLKS